MAEVVSLTAERQTVPAQTGASLQFVTEHTDKHKHHDDNGYSIIVDDPYWAIGDALVTITGLPAGEPIDLSWSRMTQDGDNWKVKDDAWRHIFYADASGKVIAQLGGQFSLDDDIRLRLRVHNPYPTPVTVEWARAKVTLLRY